MKQQFVTIEPINVDRVAAMFRDAPELAVEELAAAMQAVVLHLESEVKERTPTAFGTLRASVFGEARIEGLAIEGVVGSPLAYAPYVELGTRPHWPPIEPLKDWVRKKFALTDETEIRSRAFLVARAIASRGTLAVGMFHLAAAANERQIEARFGLAAERVAARMGAAGGAP